MKEFGNQQFNVSVDRKMKHFFKAFNKEVKNDLSPISYAKEQRTEIEKEISNAHRSNDKLNAEFFEILRLKGRKKNLTYAKVIENYCKESGKDQKEIFEFTACIVGLYRIRDKLDTIVSEYKKTLRDKAKNSKADFTTARKVLVFSFLMNDYFENSLIPDKTLLAKFLDSLISDKPPKKNVANSNLYDRVKDIFFNPTKGRIPDLEYVKGKFEELGLLSLANRIDVLITERKKKKQ